MIDANALHKRIISIHALREEGDSTPTRTKSGLENFYPRPPRGGRLRGHGQHARKWRFLSTPSARRATQDWAGGDTDDCISIHALREEGDAVVSLPSLARILFLSTPSARRATEMVDAGNNFFADFYPRPPRGGRPLSCRRRRATKNFYPRPPRGGRQCKCGSVFKYKTFLSTPSARRATRCVGVLVHGSEVISIHALREEGDTAPPAPITLFSRFLSTPSARRATVFVGLLDIVADISIHALREEGDMQQKRCQPSGGISIHALREEGDLGATIDRLHRAIFLSTPSARRATFAVFGGVEKWLISIHALREEGDD